MTGGVERWAELRDREALSEPLSEQERREAEALEQNDAMVRAQAAPLRELSRMLERASLKRPTSEDRAMVERVLRSMRATTGNEMRDVIDSDAEMERAVDPEGPHWIRPTAIAISVLLPAAAALSLILYEPKPLPKRPIATQLPEPSLAPTVIELAHARTASRGQRLMRTGQMLPSGTDLVEGDRVQSGVSPGCLTVDPAIHVCLAPHSEVRIASLSKAARDLEVLRGYAVARLEEPLKGEGFELSAASVRAQATGTIFGLDRLADAAVQIRVLEGHVRVVGASGVTDLTALQAVKYRSSGPDGVVEALPAAQQARMWDLLAGRASPPEAVPSKPESAEDSNIVPKKNTQDAATSLPAADRVPPPTAPVSVDPRELLRTAWEQLKAKQWASAADTYAVILREAPKSEQAHVVLVRLGDLQLARLDQPQQALQSYERYLREGGGPLDAEARYGRIQALARLKRAGAERAAIEEFLAKHSASFKAAALRERLLALPD